MKKIIAILLSVLMVVSMVVVFAVPASAETIVVDGDLADDGWAADGWTTVTPDNGYWQTVPKTSDTLSYKYQLRSDDTKLYGAVIADCAIVVGGNGAGTNVRLWLRTNDEATVYTHFYDINADALVAKYNTKTDANSAANIDGTSLEGFAVEKDGKSYFEFSVDLAEFGGKTSFDYFMSVSNKVNENVCLFYPVVTEGAERKTNLPYNIWDAANDITVNTADIALKANEDDSSDAPATSTNILSGKDYEISGCGVRSTYTANLTDGAATSDLTDAGTNWFGFYCNGTDESIINAPDKVGYVIFDLEGAYDIDKVRANIICNDGWGIPAPAGIAAYVSDDGDNWTKAGDFSYSLTSGVAAWTEITGNWNAKFLKVEFTLAGTFAFVNEIEAYGVAASADDESSNVPSEEESSDVSSEESSEDVSSDVSSDESSDVETEETLEDKLIAAVGTANENAGVNLVIDAPATYKAGDSITVKVTADDIASEFGTDYVKFILIYDETKLVLTNDLDEKDQGNLICLDKTALDETWEGFTIVNSNFKDLTATDLRNGVDAVADNDGKIDATALTASLYTSSAKNGEIVFNFTFDVKEDATGDIGIYIAHDTVKCGLNEENGLEQGPGNGGYAIIAEETDSDDESSDASSEESSDASSEESSDVSSDDESSDVSSDDESSDVSSDDESSDVSSDDESSDVSSDDESSDVSSDDESSDVSSDDESSDVSSDDESSDVSSDDESSDVSSDDESSDVSSDETSSDETSSDETSSDDASSDDASSETSSDDASSEVSSESSATSSETPVKPGDASNMIIFAILALVAVAGSAIVIKSRR